MLMLPLQTRWGVGFGPRDCSDYQTGISIIPIDRLTDADRKWMLTAEYGGTGGKEIESGMIAEEPDIEIGAGVSSKGKNISSEAEDSTLIISRQPSADVCRPTKAGSKVHALPETVLVTSLHHSSVIANPSVTIMT